MKILYIEDNPGDIDLTMRKLKKTAPHIEVEIARSQAEALSTIRGPQFSDYDLVLTDMHLQDGDGIAILSHIRGHSLPVAVVILTGQGDEEAAVAALKAGADDYVVKKSGYLEELPDLLDAALNSYKKERDIGVQQLKIVYLEHNQTDVDLTRRHLERYAPHIQMTPISHVAEFNAQLDVADAFDPYCAILLDYRLPQENALEIVKRIKATHHADIPIILVTGKGDEEIAVKALKLGVFDYITKNQGYLFKIPSVVENAYYSMRLSREHDALLESERRYRSLFENSHVIMVLVEPETGKIIDANPAAVSFYGWTYDELTSKTIGEINTLSDEEVEKEMKVAEKEERSFFFYRHKLADGSIREVEVYNGSIHVGGKPLIYSMIYDITKRLQAEREKEKLRKMLVQSQKMEAFGQLAGGIAHDFNNILSALIGYTEIALYEVDENSNLGEILQEIYGASKRAKELVRQILAFARQTDEEAKPIRVYSIANEVLKLIRSSTPSSIEIKKVLDSGSYILGNAIQIHQVIMNLCTNAIHAMEKSGGILTFELKDVDIDNNVSLLGKPLKQGRYIELIVSDTGAGIPKDNLELIFEPYFTTKPLGEGTGMGLAMVYGIVESYGGGIAIESELSMGTTIKIYFPITEQSIEGEPYIPQQLPKGNEKILFVDDEPAIAKMGKRILGQLGYSVETKTSSVKALEYFQENADDLQLVITDMTMPDMTGDVMATRMMATKPDIPVILCTGYSKIITDEEALKLGIKAFVFKPIVKADLANTIRKVLDEAKGIVHE